MNTYKKIELENKIPLFIVPVKGAKTATAMFMYKTGSKYENRQNSGISHFLEHMFFKGTKKRPNTSIISSELDSLGSDFNAFTGKEYTGYYVKTAASKMNPAIKILIDMLQNSIFDESEIEREKGVIIEELNMYEDNPLMHVEDVFESCLYGDSPAGWDTIGNKKTINSFKREDFINYFQSQYGSKSLSIILAGKITKKEIETVEKHSLGFVDNKWIDKEKVKVSQKKPQLKVLHKEVDQVALSLGVRTFAAGHRMENKLKMLATILGGAMSSRLFIKLRERSGLAYYVRTSTQLYSDSGYLTTQAGVPVEKAKDAIKIILDEYQDIANNGISEVELKKAKDLIVGKTALRLEPTDEVASWYAKQVMTRKNMQSPKDMLREMKKINVNDIKRVARLIFKNENLNLALIGKVKESEARKVLKFK